MWAGQPSVLRPVHLVLGVVAQAVVGDAADGNAAKRNPFGVEQAVAGNGVVTEAVASHVEDELVARGAAVFACQRVVADVACEGVGAGDAGESVVMRRAGDVLAVVGGGESAALDMDADSRGLLNRDHHGIAQSVLSVALHGPNPVDVLLARLGFFVDELVSIDIKVGRGSPHYGITVFCASL